MRATAGYFRPTNKVPGRPVGQRDLAARRCGVINPDLSMLDDEDAFVLFSLIEDVFALPNHDPAAEFANSRPFAIR